MENQLIISISGIAVQLIIFFITIFLTYKSERKSRNLDKNKMYFEEITEYITNASEYYNICKRAFELMAAKENKVINENEFDIEYKKFIEQLNNLFPKMQLSQYRAILLFSVYEQNKVLENKVGKVSEWLSDLNSYVNNKKTPFKTDDAAITELILAVSDNMSKNNLTFFGRIADWLCMRNKWI